MTNHNEQPGAKPKWQLVQKKAYFKTDDNGQRVRATEDVEIVAFWNKTSAKGNPYMTAGKLLSSIEPDVDGRINLSLIPINLDKE